MKILKQTTNKSRIKKVHDLTSKSTYDGDLRTEPHRKLKIPVLHCKSYKDNSILPFVKRFESAVFNVKKRQKSQ